MDTVVSGAASKLGIIGLVVTVIALLIIPLTLAVSPLDTSNKPPRNIRIAHVEDDPTWRADVATVLQSIVPGPSISVFPFPSCESLLAVLSDVTVNFDLYILDRGLGKGIDGLACAKEIRVLRPGARMVSFYYGNDPAADILLRETGVEVIGDKANGAKSILDLVRGVLGF